MSIFIAFDLETTGLSSRDDTIIEYAFIKFDSHSFEIYETFSWFINPGIPIPPVVSELTWIKEEDVATSPTIDMLRSDIESFIAWYPLVWHNVDFDISFLKSAGISVQNNPTIDTFFLANSLCFRFPSLSLSSLCEYFSLSLPSAHRALDDTRATQQLFACLTKELISQTLLYPDIIWYLYASAQDSWDLLVYQYYIRPYIQADLWEISDIQKKHSSFIDTAITPQEALSTSQTDIYDSTYEILQTLPKFEYRESQKQMCDIVDKMYYDNVKFAIEAPTWTWKTFVYLIAALLHAKKTWSQTCISTSTKLLQDQICEEDLKYLKMYLPFSFTFAKLTGKKNYFSIWKYYEYLELHKKFTRMQISFFLKLYLWSITSSYGELRELEYYGEEYNFLHNVDASHLFYDNSQPLSSASEFYFRARRAAELSDIIITNSYVLIQESQTPTGIFTSIDTLVVDEAHSLEDVVSSSTLVKLSSGVLTQLFWLFDRKLQKHSLNLDVWELRSSLEYGLYEIFWECEKIISPHFPRSARYKKYLFRSSDISNESYLILSAKILTEKLLHFEDMLSEAHIKKYFLKELQVIEDIKHFLFIFFIRPSFSDYIYVWDILESWELELSYSILDTGAFLKTHIWKHKTRILLTSATLFVPTHTLYSDRVLGITDFIQYSLPPVFDYKKQSYVYIPTNLRHARNLDTETLAFLEAFFLQVLWNTLMLCTSYAAIKELYLALHGKLKSAGVDLIAQWFAGGKNKHLESFLAHPESSILVWTDSFWQWVDIPGDDLQYLVIHKLPFSPPSDPIFMARSALFVDGFHDYAIPKTGIKLRQWLGRLIRSHSDTGMILFLDERVLTMKWWKYFLDIFPEGITIFQSSSDQLLTLLKKH